MYYNEDYDALKYLFSSILPWLLYSWNLISLHQWYYLCHISRWISWRCSFVGASWTIVVGGVLKWIRSVLLTTNGFQDNPFCLRYARQMKIKSIQIFTVPSFRLKWLNWTVFISKKSTFFELYRTRQPQFLFYLMYSNWCFWRRCSLSSRSAPIPVTVTNSLRIGQNKLFLCNTISSWCPENLVFKYVCKPVYRGIRLANTLNFTK